MPNKTLTITNFQGRLTRYNNGDINSGYAKYDTTFGNDPFTRPGNLTWFEQPSSVLTLTGINGPIIAMKQRVETAFSYAYSFAKNGNLYKVLSDNDTSSIIGALSESPSTTRGADMVFYGATEKIFYADDTTIQKINFDGSGGASIFGVSSITSGVPRPLTVFLGKIYYGNGNNIGEIDSTETIITGSKLNPALPSGTYIRDIDVTPDGNYLQIIATKTNPNGGFTAPELVPGAGTESYKYFWNGIDKGYASYETFGGIGLTANTVFGDKNYSLGYDTAGAAIYSGSQKIISLPRITSPYPNATFSISNMFGFIASEYELSSSLVKATIFNYGQYNDEISSGLYRPLRLTAPVRTDIIATPGCLSMSNLLYFPAAYSYADNIARPSKLYFTTSEASDTTEANNIERLWKFSMFPTGASSAIGGTYETQTQLFSKKVKVNEVRIYGEPWVANNSFRVGVIGSNGSSIVGSSKLFETGDSSTLTIGNDYAWYTPTIQPTYALGMQITNVGSANHTINKIEVDYIEAGK